MPYNHSKYRPFRTLLLTIAALLLSASCLASEADQTDTPWTLPAIVLKEVPFSVTIANADALQQRTLFVTVNGKAHQGTLEEGTLTFTDLVSDQSPAQLTLSSNGHTLADAEITALPGWFSLIPALMAVTMALLLRNVMVALFVSLITGIWMVYGMTATGLGHAILDACQVYVINALTEREHMEVVVFCFLIGGMVGIISRNGGTMGIAERITRVVKNRSQTQLSTSFLGLAIFFDDYANSLIVGNTMKKISDTMRISREKLAYIVDCTAAPVSAILFVTTWIGFQVGVINDGLSTIGNFDESAYSVFLNSLMYSFYPVLAIVFVLLIASSGKDFGPMLRAEQRAFHTGRVLSPAMDHDSGPAPEEKDLEAKPGVPHRAFNAVIPMCVLIGVTMVSIYMTGLASPDRADDSLREIIGNANSFASMMYGSVAGCIVAFVMTLGQRLLTVHEITDAWFAGAKAVMLVIFVLTLAWALSAVNTELHTSDFLISALGDTLNPNLMPLVIFLLAAFMAFATGSSWGVMGIMMPMVVPLAWAVLVHNDMTGTEHLHIFYSSVSGVLAGAIWGDHCSPLAESTLLSAMASGCDLIDHVRSQMLYCLVVGGVGMLIGTLPAGFGLPWWLCMLVGAVLLWLIVHYFGRRAEDTLPAAQVEVNHGAAESA
ncbi:Na+/H+ antiporter NhaC family protein [Simiduia aestuariiviva]|uniref:Na+/H+ antiporter NhaC n=1 Tax=Simiduia aestuariiviva TaxID=1510459 RepID=A0A839UPN1_9GAMM|nr:Na+/H+ antiporter NhaC family protein [Simiduia aestuariiviva]MBB3167746.1 Na+/H+ antiporter NhaC [Simiduia aestuariiviva]